MYNNGRGCVKDEQKALYWYEKAANQGHKEAQYQCGVLYNEKYLEFGDLHARDKAIEWYKKAAAQGHENANMILKSLIE